MMHWSTTNAEHLKAISKQMRTFKGSLTRAENDQNWTKVIALVNYAAWWFAGKGLPLPDKWALFSNAKERAEFELRRAAWRSR